MLILLAAPPAVIAQAVLPFSALTLTVSVPERPFLLLEPVPITLRVANTLNVSISGHHILDFGSEHVRVLVRPEGSESYSTAQLTALRGFTPTTLRPFAPGEFYEHTDVLMISLDNLLPRLGRYEIRAALRGDDQEIHSDWVQSEVSHSLAARTQGCSDSTGPSGSIKPLIVPPGFSDWPDQEKPGESRGVAGGLRPTLL
jgi:hypothetical protein